MKEKDYKTMTLGEIIQMPEFEKEMERQVKMELDSYKELCQEAVQKKMRVKRFPLMTLLDKDVFHADKMVELYAMSVDKKLVGFSSAERQYIEGIGLVVLGRVLEKLKKEEMKD